MDTKDFAKDLLDYIYGTDVTIAFDNQGLKTINKEYTTLDLL